MPDSNGLLPLRLVDFEQYMLVDDHADYPMVIRLELDLEGQIDAGRLQAALDRTVSENPLLHAKVHQGSEGLFWIDGDPPPIRWTETLPEMERLDLTREAGVRVFARSVTNGCHLRLFIHHSVADGSGINHFVEQWLLHYQQLGKAPLPDVLPADTARTRHCLQQRGRFGMNFFRYLLRPIQEFCGAIGVLQFFASRPVALGPQKTRLQESPTPDVPLSHRFSTLTFSAEETRQVLKSAKRSGHKVNDLMLTAMFDACYRWVETNEPGLVNRCVRIMIPMDMRSRRQPERFVGNQVSMIFVDRRPGRYRSLESLCWWVWLEMSVVKLMRLGLTFVHLIRYFRFRNRLRRLLRRDRSIATTILSNMGPILNRSPLTDSDNGLTADGVRLSELRVYPPIRAYTWTTFVITTYRNRFQLHTTWCSNSLNQDEMDMILECFKSNLLHGLKVADPAGGPGVEGPSE